MKKKIFIAVFLMFVGFMCVLTPGCACTQWGDRVKTYLKNGYILIPTAERFIECFVEGHYIPDYEDRSDMDISFEKSLIESYGGIKGYKLTADLDFTGIDITKVNKQYYYNKLDPEEYDGSYGGFSYNLDGNGFALKNITMEGDYASVFGTLTQGATIKDLTIADSTFTGGKYVGAFLSFVDLDNTYGKVINCTVSNCTIGTESSEYVGGFAGFVTNARAGRLDNKKVGFECSDINVVQSNVKGKMHVGGVMGYYRATKDSWAEAKLNKLYNTQTNVTGYIQTGDDADVGGVVGTLITFNTTATIQDCSVAFAEIKGNRGRVGGIVGNVYYKPISLFTVASDNKVYFDKCYNMKGNVTGNKYVGGIVGQVGNNYAEIKFTNCENISRVVSKTTHAGGICGFVNTATLLSGHTAIFENCVNGDRLEDVGYGASAIVGQQYVGGICGQNGKFFDCINKLKILYGNETSEEEYSYIGGIVGETQYGIKNCKNEGNIAYLIDEQRASDANFSSKIGGIVGYTNAPVENCINTATIRGKKAVGGILGYTTATALTFTGNSNSGIIVGYASYLPNATQCQNNYAFGVGGLIGIIYSNSDFVFTDCTNTGTLDLYGSVYGAGGLVGLLIKTTDYAVVTDYTFTNITMNYNIVYGSTTSPVYGALIGACGTTNGDDIDIAAENTLISGINAQYTNVTSAPRASS